MTDPLQITKEEMEDLQDASIVFLHQLNLIQQKFNEQKYSPNNTLDLTKSNSEYDKHYITIQVLEAGFHAIENHTRKTLTLLNQLQKDLEYAAS